MQVLWRGLEGHLSAVVDVDEVGEKTQKAHHLSVREDPLKLQGLEVQ